MRYACALYKNARIFTPVWFALMIYFKIYFFKYSRGKVRANDVLAGQFKAEYTLRLSPRNSKRDKN